VSLREVTSSVVSSGVENCTMIVGGHGRGGWRGQVEDMDMKKRVHVTIFIVGGTIIQLTSAGTSLVNLSGLRLLTLLLLRLLPPLLLFLVCRSFRQTRL